MDLLANEPTRNGTLEQFHDEDDDETEEEKKDGDDEYDRLLVPSGEDPLSDNDHLIKDGSNKTQHSQEQHYAPVVGFSFSMQFLAAIVLVLFIASQASLFRCCRISVQTRNQKIELQRSKPRYNQQNVTIPILRKYSLNVASATIWSSTSNEASKIERVYRGDEVVVEEDIMSASSKFEKAPYLRVLRPYLGFLEQRQRKKPLIRNNETVYPPIFEPLPIDQQPKTGEFTTDSICPLLYSARTTSSRSKLMDASPTLVVAQQFWNGMQVCLLFLVIVVHYKFHTDASEQPEVPNSRKDNTMGESTLTTIFNKYNVNKKNTLKTWRILPLVLLPFMMYLVQPDGYVLLAVVVSPIVALLGWAIFRVLSRPDDTNFDQSNEELTDSMTPLHKKLMNIIVKWTVIVRKLLSSHTFHLWAVRFLALGTICLLPFASYVSSPGGHCFAFVTAMWITLALWSPKFNLRLSLGETKAFNDEAIKLRHGFTPPYTIFFEETLGFFCTLGSSMYNYAGHTYVWPHWKSQFNKIDDYMGWPRLGDVTWEENWTMWGIFAERSVLPPFVPRGGGGSTTGAQQFWIVWSILPFLYCWYYVCMIILSQRTPNIVSRWVQRLACLFSILHFLFGTDVVHYRYGRGYRNPHSELFHWTEKWSWRVAILVPIWQNCVTGHWKNGHPIKCIGLMVHYGMMFFGIGFLVFQVLQADVINTYQFAYGYDKMGIIQFLGWGEESWLWFELEYPYMRCLVFSWLFYASLHFTGSSLFRIVLQKQRL
ncbi:hypothetical protein IV203_000438 [Nitzschia inconspicua]|uniref:Uncharacterized protein n=1 Tax=Nitzschia inconspicua TaxID=303405 RepID=A0A9K3PQ97_9STRA|nr:hypothetical protein IV203_000438 [Nitzschia inconspicua]